MRRNFPPSLSKVPGLSDAELEEEKILKRLGQIISGLTPQSGSSPDPEETARYLYEAFCIAKAAVGQKRKGGSASIASVAKQLKGIASGATTLAKRLKNASDRKVFEAWAGAAGADELWVGHHLATQEWLQLKSLLEVTAARATRAAWTAEDVLKVWASAATKGRPPDLIADAMTAIAGGAYAEWTGEPALRSIGRGDGKPQGEFHQFLKDVFDALGIPSSPDASNMRLQTELREMKRRK